MPKAQCSKKKYEGVCKKYVRILTSPEMQGRHWEQAGGRKAARWILSQLNKSCDLAFFDNLPGTNKGKSPNVVGMLEGDLRGSLVITAHYDHLGGTGRCHYPGADDNASGVAVMLCLARELCSLPREVRHTCVFVGFTGEEFGMAGSKHAARWMLSSAGNNVDCLINMDMVGRASSTRRILFGESHGDRSTREDLTESAQRAGLEIKWDHHKDWLNLSDQKSFLGMCPCILVSTESHADYHKLSDTSDKIDYGLLGRLVCALLGVCSYRDNE